MGIPTDIKPFVTTKLISPLGKLRRIRFNQKAYTNARW